MSIVEPGAIERAPATWEKSLRRATIFLFLVVSSSVDLAFAQGYGGPAISGVPAVSAGSRAGRAEGISYFAGVQGSYDTGLTPVSVDSNGSLVQTGALYGANINWGAFGTHRGRRYTIGLDYIGAYRHYSGNTYYNGLDSILALDISRQLTKRTQWFAAIQGGTVSAAYGGYIAHFGFLPGTVPPGVPVNDIYDNRSYFLSHTQAITYLLSPRLAVTAGGTGVVVRRQSAALAGLNGYGAQGSLSYRLTQMSSVSLNYNWFHYDYPHEFGEATVNELMAGFVHRLSRRWSADLNAGAFKVETEGLTSVSPDPAVVALFGETHVVERYYAKHYYPSIAAALSGRYRRYGLAFGYSRRPSPGNGVYLASASQNGYASASYTGIRRWNFGVNAYYSRLASVGQNIPRYGVISGGGGATYRMYRNLSATFRADARTWQINQSTNSFQASYRVLVGVALSPSDLPLSLW
jgi:hypothetical protein